MERKHIKVPPAPEPVPLMKRDVPCLQVLHGHTGAVLSCAFDAVGATLATGSADGEVRLWRVVSGEWRCVKTLELGPAVRACEFQPARSGGMLCTGTADNCVRVWKALKGDCVAMLVGHKDPVTSVSFDPLNGDILCSGSEDTTVRVWKVSAQKQTRVFEGKSGHRSPVTCVSYNPNGDLILAGAQDKTLRLWSARSGELLQVLKGHDGIVHALAFHTQNEWVVTGGKDKNLRIWRESDGEHHKDVPGHKGTVHSLAFDRETGCIMASGDGDGPRGKTNNVWLWEFSAGKSRTRIQGMQNTHVLRGHEGAVRCLSFGPHGHLLCSASDDTCARIWKVGNEPPGSRAEMENAHMKAAKEAEQAAGAKDKKPPTWLGALAGAGDEAEEPVAETTHATYRRKLRAQSSTAVANPFKEAWTEVQEQWWDFVLRNEIGESGTQCHQNTCPPRRVNGGHENVYGWVDDEQSKKSPRGSADGCAQQ